MDGASTDNTQQVVEAFQLRTAAIRYRRMPVNRGIDPDVTEAVAMSAGEYVQLMSSDDVIEGAVAKVVDALARRAIYLGGRGGCTEDLRVFGRDRVVQEGSIAAWNFAQEAELVAYLRASMGLGVRLQLHQRPDL